MLKYIYCLFLSLLLVFLTQSVLTAFFPAERINLLLIFLVFITFVSGLNWGFIFALFIGLFLNFYSYLPFGSYVLIFWAVVFSVDYLHKQIFINFTFATNVILITASTFLYTLLLVLMNFIFYVSGLSRVYIVLDQSFGYNLLWQLFNNLLLMSIVFIFAKAIFKKLNLTILVKR